MRKLAILMALILLTPKIASADESIITIDVEPPDTPRPVSMAEYYWEHDWDSKTVNAVASVYWAECNTDPEKEAITKVLKNRLDHGAPFADTIAGVAMQKGEFNTGHISDRNRELARINLNKVWTHAETGCGGITVPGDALYMRRENGIMVFLNDSGEIVYRVED